MDISFGWTSEALLAGAKTCTRRDWVPKYALQFGRQYGWRQPIRAWDRSPRFGGQVIGYIRLTHAPYAEALRDAPDDDYVAEGFAWYASHPEQLSATARKALDLKPCQIPDRRWWDWWREHGFSGVRNTLYVVRFRLC